MSEMQYFNSITLDGITYSIDMLKLNLDFYYGRNQELLSWLQNQLNLDYKHYTSTVLHKYRDMFSFNLKNGETFTFGIGLNELTSTDYSKGFLRFNPNKCCNEPEFNNFLNRLNYSCKQVLIKQWDMAIDILVKRQFVKVRKDNRKYMRFEHGAVTEYLGSRSNEGYFKCYDKQKESKLYYPLTRLELTIDGTPSFDYVKDLFPKVDILKNQYDMDSIVKLSQNDLVFLRLLLASDDFDFYYNQLNYRYRQKFWPYIFDKSFELSRKGYSHLEDILRQFIKIRTLK